MYISVILFNISFSDNRINSQQNGFSANTVKCQVNYISVTQRNWDNAIFFTHSCCKLCLRL